jgi:hypothetical protein
MYPTWVFSLIRHLGIQSSDNSLFKKSHLSMRMWIQSAGSSKNIRVCKFRLKFISYIYIRYANVHREKYQIAHDMHLTNGTIIHTVLVLHTRKFGIRDDNDMRFERFQARSDSNGKVLKFIK